LMVVGKSSWVVECIKNKAGALTTKRIERLQD